MNKAEAAEKDVLDAVERAERKLSWEDQIMMLENVRDFINERLKELKNQDQTG